MIVMEKHFKNEDQLLKKLIQESELEQPSLDFSKRVMEQITEQENKVVYTPLLPRYLKIFIVLLLVAAVGWLFFNPSSSIFAFGENQDFIATTDWTSFLPNVSLSKIEVYALLFLGLFLIQVPYLKRMLDRQY